MTRLDLALRMAADGWPVFPLRPLSKKPYASQQKRAPGELCTDEGIGAATTDLEKIREWFASRPNMNYGVSTSEGAVLDVDVKNGAPGLQTLETFGAIPRTLQVITPTGGIHLYFSFFSCGQAVAGPGVDVRSTNGYVVGPGSFYDGEDGRGEYRISVDAPVAPMPAHLAKLTREPAHRREIDRNPIGELDEEASVQRGVAYLERIEGAPEGARDNTGYVVACHLKDFGLSPDTIQGLMAEHWNNKNSPPLDAWQLEKLARNAYQNGQLAPGSRNPSAEFEPIPADDVSEALGSPQSEKKPLFRPMHLDRDPRSVPRRDWLIKNLLLHGHLTGLSAPGGVGKSSFALGLAISVAIGAREAFGFPMRGERKPVVFVSTEEDEDELYRRIWAYCEKYEISTAELNGWLHVFDGSDFKALKRDPQSRQLRTTKALAELRRYIIDVGAGLVIYDPLVEMHEANENDNAELAQVMSALRSISRQTRAAGLVSHHTKKNSGGPGDADSARGGSAFTGNVRLSFTLFRATAEDAQELGFDERTAERAFRLDRCKGNYVPPGRDTKWFQTVSMTMPNGDVLADEEGDGTHAIEMLDAEASRRAAVLTYFAALEPLLEDAENNEVTLSQAAAVLVGDPTLGGANEAQLKKRIERTFAAPVTYEGYTMQVLDVGDVGAKRKTWRLRGWREA